MTHYLRDQQGNTVVDIEATKRDISAVVVIPTYSLLLLAEAERQWDVISDFSRIQEIRAEYFESGWEGTTDSLVQKALQELAHKYDLAYVTD